MKRLHDLDGYVTGEMSDAAAEAFEEELFASPDDGDVDFMDRVARHGSRLVEHGTWDMGCTKAHVDALIAKGYKVEICDAGPPGTNTLSFGKEAELIVTRLPFNRTDHPRVDVEIYLPVHDVTKVIKDSIVDTVNGALYGLCERPLAELAFGTTAIVRVRANSGRRELLAEWTLSGNLAP